MAVYTQDDILEAARKASKKIGGPLLLDEFALLSGIPRSAVYRLFPSPGGWSEVVRRAGIPFDPKSSPRMSDDEALAEYHRVACLLGRTPTVQFLEKHSRLSRKLLHGRFGLKPQVLRRYKAWLEQNHPDSKILVKLKENPRALAPVFGGGPKARQLTFGDPMVLPGLLHAPTNEMGVICLFGMLCWKLGFVVESIRTVFPDCEAKRCIDRKRGRWLRVRIEFEYASSGFQYHGHDPAGCDLIVCWAHDWPACPLEVLELRSVLHKCFPPELVLLRQEPPGLMVWNDGDPAPAGEPQPDASS